MSAVTASKSFRPDIEGLRALAVSGVIAFHFGYTGLPGGFVGVDIFFVISGYLITQHLQQEIAKHGTVNLWTFYARRARRLLPASLFVILVTLVAGYFILAPSEQQLYSKGALFASTYIINLWLIRWSLDYFAVDATNNPFIHFWSLSVEEQFYLAWPALLLLFTRMRPGKHGVFLLMAAVAAISFALCAWLTTVSQPWAFYFSPLRAWEFALGGLASMALLNNWAKRFAYSPAMGWIGLALIAIAYLRVSEQDAFPGFIALVPALGTVMVLLSGVHLSSYGPRALLAIKPAQWIGKLSYSLYLWHWPVIVYAAMLVPDLTSVQRILLMLLTLALSIFSYRFVENPIRRNAWLMVSTRRSLAFAALLTMTGVTVGYASATLAKRNLSPQQEMILETAERPSTVRATDKSCVLDLETVKPKPCVFGSASSNTKVVLFGDSHADHWSTPLVDIAKKDNIRLVTYLKSSCRATRITTRDSKLRRDYTECNDWRELAIKEIIAMKPQTVIISQLSISHLTDEIGDPSEYSARKKEWADGIRSTVEVLSNAGIKVVFLRDVPTHTSYLDKCVARALWQGRDPSVCDTPRAAAADDSDAETEKGIISGIKNARYIDMTEFFCSNTICHAMIDGKLTFRDRHHIATPYAESLAAPLERAIFKQTIAGSVKSEPVSEKNL
ncbi:acyltransferase family protein [Phyllobacterium zundukense]|jgi:peptidoglycan/LPS O-acetylase OafA/YrhL|uniref:Acyltransferase n=1 Tax=Phyllobacterium zundukense TaxID=1867719 RepID=A0ACD4D651_9HYPH|nr:acyltransferase family protein [Phyllobacterium zundukense]UXN61346.1 acyltransferase [Phyllobacterium zundukense]